ncbi:PP2C family protein-serine/threonine phosphatase [Nocardiopsis algeriensis]|uniref:Serine phosphatase RsbU (Regulator of sigma subunit) n=1 Tax=Nocardiopsis algeriensis TaxID=1478215 RepID=A0A841ITQ3_9ACTN|nr:serine phosphatase RsbU (regulator of sigma subunit) [Nocardiopsis algeriensis]
MAVASHLASFNELPGLIATEAARAGLKDVRVYIADRQERVLREMTGAGIDAHEGGEELRVDGTVAGMSYTKGEPVQVDRGKQYWIPVLDGTERIGVLHVDHTGEPDLVTMKTLASMVGLLLVDKRTNSDAYARLIRTQPMSVSAEMQWTLMPPSTFSNKQVTVSAVTEPAYDNAGDSFDYALDGTTLRLAMFDAMGHDDAAGLLAALTVGAFRNQRRKNTALSMMPARVEATLTQEFVRNRYTTGIMGELDLDSGVFSWVNCGHLPPVLIRDDKARELEGEPTHPLGTDLGLPVAVYREQLHPGDRLVLYTDGIIEARNAHGREFGLEQFVNFIILHEVIRLPVPETLRLLIQAVMAHHHGQLGDDATVLVCEWHG